MSQRDSCPLRIPFYRCFHVLLSARQELQGSDCWWFPWRLVPESYHPQRQRRRAGWGGRLGWMRVKWPQRWLPQPLHPPRLSPCWIYASHWTPAGGRLLSQPSWDWKTPLRGLTQGIDDRVNSTDKTGYISSLLHVQIGTCGKNSYENKDKKIPRSYPIW